MLDWAKKTGGFIIEDDYDTEFRFRGHPIPPMQTLDPERVIYMNTFSKTLNYLMHSSNAGIVMGAAAPIILPSRASDPASKYASLAMGVLLAK